jgi:hypothetical protein
MSGGYVMLPVRPKTKALVDAYRQSAGAHSYDEAIRMACKPSLLERMSRHEGIIAGWPAFKRDKRERNFD